MSESSLDRRDFHRLTSAALGGLAAGALLGCNQSSGPTNPGTLQAAELHLCRGLNDCQGKGQGAANDCRGQGACATVKEHSCGGQNDCKGLGGCGEDVGANDCKTKGGCHVPLMDSAWEKLRKRKEAEWTEKKLPSSPAPAKQK